MDLRESLVLLRLFWKSIAAFALVGLALAATYSANATKVYQASVQLFVSAQAGTFDNNQVLQGSQFSQQRVKSYADIVGSEAVMSAVIRDLHLSLAPRQLSRQVSASAPLDTVLVNVTVRDKSPSAAQAIANDVGTTFTRFVNQLESPVSGGASPVKVSVVQPAVLPTTPASPRVGLDLMLGGLLGLALGLGQAFLRGSLDTTIKGAGVVAEIVDKPLLGLIPFDPEAQGHPVITDSSPHSLRSEAFRQLRTNLQFVDIDNPPRSIVVTSSVPKEGKSTSTANLAVSMARAGLKVVVVEADLRRPRLMQYLGYTEKSLGLTDILIGRASIDQAIIKSGPAGIAFLASGTTPPNPSELLASASMQRVIDALEERFDVVLIDAPPLLPVTDAAVLSVLSDGVLLVVRSGSTKREQLVRSKALLDGVDARILGVVLNRVDRKNRDAYGYYYYYSDNAGTRRRRSMRNNEPAFTPDPLRPARASRRPEAPTAPRATEVTGPIPVERDPLPPRAPASGSRVESVRAAVLQAFERPDSEQ